MTQPRRMNMHVGGRAAGPALALLIACLLGTPAFAAADLATARAQYAAASYEEALASLAGLAADQNNEQVFQLRALCLLALGRTSDAQQALSQLVMLNPLFQLEPGEVSPKLVAMFKDVRRDAVPAAARDLYAKAKASYDAKQWSLAHDRFQTLLKLLGEPETGGSQAGLADLKQLGDGFLKLTDSELAAETRKAEEAAAAKEAADKAAAQEAARVEAARLAAEREAAAAANAAATGSTTTAAPGRATAVRSSAPVYSAADADVTRPVEVRRVMPRWMPPTRAMALSSHTGLLELIIDEAGSVAEARVNRPISPGYDQNLLELARAWRYKPATKDGQPVRYRIVLEVVLRPVTP